MPDQKVLELSKEIPNIDAYLIGITHIHAACIEHDKTQATFLPPLSYSKVIQYWKERFDQVLAGHRHIFVEIAPIASRKAQLASPFKDNQLQPIYLEEDPGVEYEVSGVVALWKPSVETGTFRGTVEKLLVNPNHRQKGTARRVMTELERVALQEGRTSLILDTVVGSAAESVYPKLGYDRVGIIPQHGYSPVPGLLYDELMMHKNLKKGSGSGRC